MNPTNMAVAKARVRRRAMRIGVWVLKRGLLAALLALPFFTAGLLLSSTLWLLAVVLVYPVGWFANTRYSRRFDRRRQRRAATAAAELRTSNEHLHAARQQLAERATEVRDLQDELRRGRTEQAMTTWPTRGVKHDLNHLALPINTLLKSAEANYPIDTGLKDLASLVRLMLKQVDDFAVGLVTHQTGWEPRLSEYTLDSLLTPCEAFARSVSSEGQRFEARYDGATRLTTDGIAFGRVVQNLLANALHPDVRARRVVLTVESDRTDGTLIRVDDDGDGAGKMTREELQSLGDPAQADGTRGRGLGLFLCRRFVEGLQGTWSAAHNPGGGGLRFEVRLPREYTEPTARSRQ